jgi:hypothetical protein
VIVSLLYKVTWTPAERMFVQARGNLIGLITEQGRQLGSMY